MDQDCTERDSTVTQMKHICWAYWPWFETPIERQMELVRQIEESCFNAAVADARLSGIQIDFGNKKFVERYSAVCSKVISSIDVLVGYKTDYTISRILSGEFRAADVGTMTSYELYPAASELERAEINIRLEQEPEKKTTKRYTCRKCGGNSAEFREYQALRADESNSHSLKCTNPGCGHVWRR